MQLRMKVRLLGSVTTIGGVGLARVGTAAEETRVSPASYTRSDKIIMTINILKYVLPLLLVFSLSASAVGISADKVLIEKRARRLSLFSKGKKIKVYKVALGRKAGPKEREGDNKTPEGIYTIDSRNKKSDYHLALHVSYPNEKDWERARELGVSPGGNIMIHGIKNGFGDIGSFHTGFNWTNGCIAVTDEEIAEIDKLVPDGTLVEIRP
jgi:murein L,D-transpeptidase YafK